MSKILTPDFLVGNWTYRSWKNSDDLTTPLQDDPNDPSVKGLLFGSGYIRIDEMPINEFQGKIFGPKSSTNPNPFDKPYSWELDLKGSMNYGDPFSFRFQGKGVVGGSEWIYDYQGYMVKPWPNGINQVPAMVGTIVRTIPHPDGSGGTSPAGFVASWYAVRYREE